MADENIEIKMAPNDKMRVKNIRTGETKTINVKGKVQRTSGLSHLVKR